MPSPASRSWAARIFGGRNVVYYLVQAATTLILVLAANTAYADFPRLASIVSRDRFLPRQFMNQGDRLAFSNGIVILSVVRGRPDRRIPRQHALAAAALHDWRVHLVHAVAGRHGDPLAARRASRAGRPAPSSTASAPSSPASCSSSSRSPRRSRARGSSCCSSRSSSRSSRRRASTTITSRRS